MTFQCYIPRSSQRSANGAIFVTSDGDRRLITDQWLAQAELLEHGRLLRLTYTCCTIEVAGQRLDALFEDVTVGRLGMVFEGSSIPASPDQPWVSSLVAIPPAVTAPAFESE